MTSDTPEREDVETKQKLWDDAVQMAMEILIKEIPNIPKGDVEIRAELHQNMLALEADVAQCGPKVRAMYIKAMEELELGS